MSTVPRRVFPLPRITHFPAMSPGAKPQMWAGYTMLVQESPWHLSEEQQGSWERAIEHSISKVHPWYSGTCRQGGEPPDLLHLLLPQHRPGQFCPCGENLSALSCPASHFSERGWKLLSTHLAVFPFYGFVSVEGKSASHAANNKKHLKMMTRADKRNVTWNSMGTAPFPPMHQKECHTGRQ